MLPDRIVSRFRNLRWFANEPSIDTAVAAASAVAWIAGYYLLVHMSGQFWSIYGYFALVALVILPAWWFCIHRKRPLFELGITGKRWKESLLIGVVVAIPFLWLFFSQYSSRFGTAALLPQLIVNAL